MFSKEFLNRWFNIFIIVSVIVTILVFVYNIGIRDYSFFGFPFKWREFSGLCFNRPCVPSYNYLNFFLDVIFWAVIALGINYLIEWRKNRKDNKK